MNNDTIKTLRDRVENDGLLTKDEQLLVLQDLFRANRRILAAKKAGYRENAADRGVWMSPSARPAEKSAGSQDDETVSSSQIL
ncbi:hypothetical protein [Enterovirga rhinocerotis]|uniref:hypothetical protein n=1 Tax=Enterovirga rhinocerotis TaxID=1339210 RepID=UPI00105B235E|nr:hypothetical protein [Enterovirga rhinocerotis]